jgi:AmmeMemoRadiSam system protein B
MDGARPLPRLRLAAIDLFPVEERGRQLFCLRDRTEPEALPLILSEGALLLASLLDGTRTFEGVRAAFLLQTGSPLVDHELTSFLTRLERANLLESDRYRERLEQRVRSFREQRERPASHAGGAYPGTARELKPFLDRFFSADEGPGSLPGPSNGRGVRALIAPHIDLHRGGPTYAWTYKALAEREPAELYVLLGTCHTPMSSALAATRKPYATPLGPAPADLAFLDALERLYPGDLYQDELSHRTEHSLEFQAVYLRYLNRVGESEGAAVVPLLCGSLHERVPEGGEPTASSEVMTALAALRDALSQCGRRVCLVAGADLAHIGPQFGDATPVTPDVLESVGSRDEEMLEIICRGEADEFYRQVMEDGDARRICGLAPIYYLLALAEPARGQLLKYSQWVDEQGRGSVTYAGVLFEE